MIKVSDLYKSYGNQVLFRDAGFTVNARERVGLVGRNGHGKTTLFRLILGEETPDSGTISLPKNYRIGYLQQHLNFTRPTILEEACLGLPVGHEHDVWIAKKILTGLGFTQTDMQRPPAEFSGGFQVRLNLAKVLISEPDLLLLDEPTNYLDIVSIRWLKNFLNNWKRELILITHDRQFMDSVTTHTMGIHRQTIRKVVGDTQKLYDQILQEEEIYERTRINDEKKRREVEQFICRFRAKARLANLVQSRIKALEKTEKKEKLQKLESLEFSFNVAPFSAKFKMEIENLAFKYGKNQPYLFESLDLTIGRDERICVVGKNGKGKTTLLKVLAGKLKSQTGRIKAHPNLEIAYFEQTNTADLDPNKTIEQEIMAADSNCTQQHARNIAGAMMFSGDQALKKISVLSGGEKSRVLLGKLLVSPCHLLLLDEPTNHLDMESCDALLEALDAFDGAVVLVTHNEMFLETLAERLIVFDRGKQFVYERGYRNFLHDVGWAEEELPAPSRDDENGRATSGEILDKKELKRLKAELIQQKSRTLKPLQAKMEDLEHDIEKIEAEVSETNRLLIQASTAGDARAIAELAMKEQELRAKLEALYDDLDHDTQLFEQRSQEFEEKLANFN